MVHWPESMFTYVPEEKLLFSMDAFGQHYATSERFDDEADLPTVMQEAKTYYANIVMPYGKAVLSCLERIAGLEIGMIAPSHGLIWRSHGAEIVEAYRNWANHRPQAEGAGDLRHDVGEHRGDGPGDSWRAPRSRASARELIHIRRSNLTQIAGEVLDAAAVAFGSSTLNRGMMPMAAATLSYLEGLRPLGKAALAFGSYGWGRGGPEAVDQALRALEWEIVREPIRARYRPDARNPRPVPRRPADCWPNGPRPAAR